MTAADVLRAAADLVENGWTQGQFACRADGTPVDWHRPDAARFCATAAMSRVVAHSHDKAHVYREAYAAILRHVDAQTVSAWNDDQATTQADVVAVLRAAADGADPA